MTRGQDPMPEETAPEGAVDHDYDDAALSAREQLTQDRPETAGEIVVRGLAFDLVTRQVLFVGDCVAEDLVEYYEREEFDLLNYGVHPWLPVTIDDAVFSCVYVGDVTAESLGDVVDANQYDFPRGRLASVPVHLAWGDE